MSLISIITPAYQAEDTIVRAVKSVLAQTHADWEMIIVSDDGKDYQTILAAHNIMDPRLRFASTEKIQSSPSCGRNIALDMVRGDFITTLDADDEYHPQYLEILLKPASQYGVAMVRLAYKTKPGGEKEMLFVHDTNRDAGFQLLTLDEYVKMNGCTITMFARALLKHRYLETIRYAEDFLFDVRFFEAVSAIPVFNERFYIYHYHEKSLTSIERADQLFIDDYKKVITMLEAMDTIQPWLKNKLLALYHHRLFQNYLYVSAKAQGECADFFEFMAQHPEYFT